MDGRIRIGRVLRILGEIDADVVALQEVLSIPSGTPEDDQARFLAGQLGYHFRIGETRRLRGGSYGNVTLSRLPIVSHRNYDITQRGREERGCLRTDVRFGSRTLHIFNLHLGTAFRERRYQAQRLAGHEVFQTRDKQGPRVILGDFNEWISGLASRLFRDHFQGTRIRPLFGRSRSYPGVLPILHLDHIYYDLPLVVERAEPLRNLRTLFASDHLPIIADFRIPE